MSWKLAGWVGIGLTVLVLVARAMQAPESGTASWDGARAAGFAGYVLLWASTALGLALHLRVWRGPRMGVILELHRVTSTLGVALVAVHLVALLVDPVVGFSPAILVVPWGSAYRPFATSLGVGAAWLSVAILASTAAAPYLGRQRWHLVHLLAYLCYGASLLHGLLGGTEGDARWSLVLYAGTAAAVAALAGARLMNGAWTVVGDEV